MGAYLVKLTDDMKAAMRAGEKEKLTVLRMLISDIKKKVDAEGACVRESKVVEVVRQRHARCDALVHSETKLLTRRRRINHAGTRL